MPISDTGIEAHNMKPAIVIAACLANLIVPMRSTWAGNQCGPGVSDTEIKVGNPMQYSGAASLYGTIGRSDLFVSRSLAVPCRKTVGAQTLLRRLGDLRR